MSTLTLDKALDVAAGAIAARVPIILEGPPGIGKSDALERLAARAGRDFRAFYPAMMDPTDFGGLPVAKEGRLERLMDEWIAEIFEARGPLVVLFDELGQASPAVQAAVAPLFYARRIGKHKLPDHVSIVAATNGRQHFSGAGPLLSHLQSRAVFLQVRADLEGWATWALEAGLSPIIVGFLRYAPNLLSQSPEKAGALFPSPRGWALLWRLWNGISLDIASGVVGDAAALQFWAWFTASQAEPDVASYLDDPGKLTKSLNEERLYGISAGLSWAAGVERTHDIMVCADRLLAIGHGAYGLITLRDHFTRFPSITSHPAWRGAVAGGPGAALVSRVLELAAR